MCVTFVQPRVEIETDFDNVAQVCKDQKLVCRLVTLETCKMRLIDR